MSTEDGKGHYAVGYGRPPAHTRFLPGQSGNPAGRRKGQPSVQDLMLREAARLVKVKSGESVEAITKHEVVVRQLWKAAMQGDLAAIRMLLTFMATAPVATAEGGPQDDMDALSLPAKPDDEAMRRMLARFAHLQSDEATP
jgi:hypothetical protein